VGVSASKTRTSDATAFLAQARDAVNAVFAARADEIRRAHPGRVGEAIVYALEGPGKRLRPALTLAAYAEGGGQGDATELAAAVEVIHTYSLVHDDLPCMDDDDLRRGRQTVHKVFDVATATEAGLRMVPLAARFVARGARALGLAPAVTGEIGRTLFAAAGGGGMIGGQVLDLEAAGRPATFQELVRLHRMKTGALLTASLEIGAIAARLGEAGGLVVDHPGRFGQLAALPLPDVDAAIAEIAYCCDHLDVDGFALLTNVGGTYLGDRSREPVLRELNRRELECSSTRPPRRVGSTRRSDDPDRCSSSSSTRPVPWWT